MNVSKDAETRNKKKISFKTCQTKIWNGINIFLIDSKDTEHKLLLLVQIVFKMKISPLNLNFIC